MERVTILDTTLRDGTQGVGVNFTLQDKLDISRRLDDFGVDYIEGGFPLASERESEYFRQMRKIPLKKAKLVAFGSTRRPEGQAATDRHLKALLEAETQTVVVVGKGWKAHVDKVVGTSCDENLNMIEDSVSFLKSQQREVILDIEHFFDGWKDDPEYSTKILQVASDAGADWLVFCDTNGGTMPWLVSEVMTALKGKRLARLGIHTHDDSGCAVALALAAVRHGARQVHGTINGWGERCGNANLCTIIPNLCLKMDSPLQAKGNLSELTSLARYVADKANIIPDRRHPYVGSSAFAHKAGQHADVINKASELMEHISAAQVGNTREVTVSELAGRSTLVYKLQKFGKFTKKSAEVEELFQQLKTKEAQGYEYEAAEASFELLVLEVLKKFRPLFKLKNYHLEIAQTSQFPSQSVGRVFVAFQNHEIMGAAVGHGPVDTLDQALRNALRDLYPQIAGVHLTDYRVRVLNSQEGAAAKVRVLISCSDGQRTWDTIGVSTNVIEASWQALVDAFDYYFNLVEAEEDNAVLGARELV